MDGSQPGRHLPGGTLLRGKRQKSVARSVEKGDGRRPPQQRTLSLHWLGIIALGIVCNTDLGNTSRCGRWRLLCAIGQRCAGGRDRQRTVRDQQRTYQCRGRGALVSRGGGNGIAVVRPGVGWAVEAE